MIFLYLKKFLRYLICKNVVAINTKTEIHPKMYTLSLIDAFSFFRFSSFTMRRLKSFLSCSI